MRTDKRLFFWCLVLTLTLVSCRDSGTSSTPDKADIPFTIELTTSPDPPVAGQVALHITLSSQTDAPIKNATVTLIGSHVGMGNMIVQGDAVAQGNGRYTTVLTFGPDSQGEWLVTVEVRGVEAETIRQNFKINLE